MSIPMTILGLSFYYHDAAAALLNDGTIVALAQEERFSRKKNDQSYPEKAIEFCLKQAGMAKDELDAVVFYEKPFLKFERIFLSSLQSYPQGWRLFREAMKEWFFHKLWVKELIISRLDLTRDKVFFVQHHASHAASAYFASGLKESAIVTIDGVGEWATATIQYGKDHNITKYKEIRFPHSLGLLYSTFTSFLGFEVNEGEYKVMGMAAFGKPRYVDKVSRLIKLYPDGSFALDLSYFTHHYSPYKLYNSKFISLFGEPRNPKSLFFTRDSGYPKYFGDAPSTFSQEAKANQYHADLAASLQKVTEDVVVGIVKEAQSITKSLNLCLAGGVALNGLANGKIARECPLENFFIQPAAGDAGGALGAALTYYHTKAKNPKTTRMSHVYYGKSYTDGEIKSFLSNKNIPYAFYDNEMELLQTTVDAIIQGKVVGWFQGRFEWGPRALGNRSIIADPRNKEMKDIINAKIKFREPYRPFAPSVLSEHVQDFFEYKASGDNDPAAFMLVIVPVKEAVKKRIPAVTHVDGTARIQIVTKEANPLYWKLIDAFYKKTGVPMLLNTSFNLKGEPIVTSPQDAYKTFIASDMDMLVIGKYSISNYPLLVGEGKGEVISVKKTSSPPSPMRRRRLPT